MPHWSFIHSKDRFGTGIQSLWYSFPNFASSQWLNLLINKNWTCQFSTLVQYCAKVMQVKCVNFILCLSKLSKKVREKVWVTIQGLLSKISLEQRTLRNRGHSSKFNLAHTSSIGRPRSHTYYKDVRLLKFLLVWELETVYSIFLNRTFKIVIIRNVVKSLHRKC